MRGTKSERPVCHRVTRRLLGDVKLALQSMAFVSGDLDPPFWIDGNGPFQANEALPMRNHVVHLPGVVFGELADQSRFVIPATPNLFCTYALNFNFDLDAGEPTEWLKFLASIWPDDQESIDALQDWFGYCLLPDTRQEKIGLFIGPKRSGRGTIARLLTALVGPENVAGPRLASFATNFGLEPLITKPLAIIGDARISGRADTGAITETLLGISGEDTFTIDRKHKSPWTGKLPTRIMLLSNELPKLPDQSGALVGRFLVWKFTESFFGKEDLGLDARLKAELPSILLWAITGYQRLRARGRFVQPKSADDLLDEVRDMSSPVGAYVRERGEIGHDFDVDRADLFSDWCGWCEAKRLNPGDEGVFGRGLRAVLPSLGSKQRRLMNGTRVRCHVGIRLKTGLGTGSTHPGTG